MNNRKPFFNLDIEKFIEEWSQRYPIDRYIRKKYGIMFGSPEHRALSFINMAIEFKEDLIVKRKEDREEDLAEKDFYKDFPGFIKKDENQDSKPVKMTKKEIDAEFENINLSDFND